MSNDTVDDESSEQSILWKLKEEKPLEMHEMSIIREPDQFKIVGHYNDL